MKSEWSNDIVFDVARGLLLVEFTVMPHHTLIRLRFLMLSSPNAMAVMTDLSS